MMLKIKCRTYSASWPLNYRLQIPGFANKSRDSGIQRQVAGFGARVGVEWRVARPLLASKQIMKARRKTHFPKGKIKAIMQSDEDIGRLAAPVPSLMSRSCVILGKRLVEAACAAAQAQGHTRLVPSHFRRAVLDGGNTFAFLKEALDDVEPLSQINPALATATGGSRRPAKKRKKTSAKPASAPAKRQAVAQPPALNPPPTTSTLVAKALKAVGTSMEAKAVLIAEPATAMVSTSQGGGTVGADPVLGNILAPGAASAFAGEDDDDYDA